MSDYKIDLIPKSGGGELIFPMLPETIKGKSKTKYQTYKVISNGQCELPKGTDCDEFSWEGLFPGGNSSLFLPLENDTSPNDCVTKILNWMKSGEVINLVISGTVINVDVTISDFSYAYKGAYGDIEYDITLTAYKNLKIYTTDDLDIETPNSKMATKVGGRGSKSSLIGTKYKIKKGDSLYSIALMVYGDGAKWEKIWKKNKTTLDKAAKKKGKKNSDKGRILVPGTKIKIP